MNKYFTQALVLLGVLAGLVQESYGQQNTADTLSGNPRDSVIVNFGNKTRMIIVSSDKSGIRDLQKYDFNEILKDVGIFMEKGTDSRKGGKDVYLYISDATGRRYLRDTTLVVSPGDSTYSESPQDSTSAHRDWDDEDEEDDEKEDEQNFFNHTIFSVDLGFNNYLSGGQFPSRYDSPYGLRPLGSRYIAFSLLDNERIGGKNSPLFLRWGLELAWNNLMFQGNNYVQKTPNGVTFPDFFDNNNTPVELQKSKLTVCYLSVPVLPTLQFRDRNGRRTIRISAGGYAGIRLNSYTKIKYSRNDNTVKQHDRGDFFLNDFRYGLMGQIGIRGVALFAKYDLNPLYSDGKGPDLRLLSFGITVVDF